MQAKHGQVHTRRMQRGCVVRFAAAWLAVVVWLGWAALAADSPPSIATEAPPNVAADSPPNAAADPIPALTADRAVPPHRAVPLHHFDLACERCHDPDAPDGPVKDVAAGCSSQGCHAVDPKLSHPMGRPSPTNRTIASTPQTTCLSCHLDSSGPRMSVDEQHPAEPMLTVREGIDVCASCHLQLSLTGPAQYHWRFSTRAHLAPMAPSTDASKTETRSSPGLLDTESRTCMSCHDEVSVVIPDDHETFQQRRRRWLDMSDHPIGMSYQLVAARRVGRYRPLLPGKSVRLFDGRLGCGSCHSLYADSPSLLVDRFERGDLCRRCHIK